MNGKTQEEVEAVIFCRWDLVEEAYETECGHAFFFDEGSVEENEFEYCPFCGKTIAEF